jgi:seryl-tRNA synthetase
MDTRVWEAPVALGPEGRRTFDELLPYCFDGRDGWVAEPGERPRVRYVADDSGQAEEIEARLAEATGRAAIVPARTPRTVLDLWSTAAPAAPQPLAVTPVGPGLMVSGPGVARLMRIIDDLAWEMAGRLGAVEYAVPHLTSWSTIERAGYARTFPQHLTTCGVVSPDLGALDRFARAGDPDARAAELNLAPVTVSPTVCLHLFAALADTRLDRPLVITARQSCGRHEPTASAAEPTRLWSFTMREIVYIGDSGGARRFCADIHSALAELARDLGLPSRIASATDPFFTNERADLTKYQSTLDLKQEMCGRMAPDDRAVAVSSVNLHHQHFGKGFDIRTADGTIASSACVGFGLERWAQWLHGYLGDDAGRWPDVLRRRAGG